MKLGKALSVFLATAMVSTGILAIAGCGTKETGTSGTTDYGNKTYTDSVKNPSKEVTITLIRGKEVLKTATDELEYNGTLEAGDIIEIDSDYCYVYVDLFDNLGKQLIYSPSGQFTFQVPSSASQSAYKSGTFSATSHVFQASVASDSAVAEERNLAVNPYDYMYVDEKNDADATTLSDDLLESAAVEEGEVTAYPHAYANRVTRNEVGFYARNAIDGNTTSDGHGSYPYESWGYNQKNDAEFVVYFGREVTLSSVSFVLRADYSGTKEHDTYWEDVTVEFSDGTSETFNLKKTGDKQDCELSKEVTTTSVRIKGMTEHQDSNSEMYAALTEFEAYGMETVSKNQVATKTSVTYSYGGKTTKSSFTTSDYSYQDIKDTMDKANDWFINITETTTYTQPNSDGSTMTVKINDAGWKDAVYYSGLMESFLTTGDMDSYYFLRAVGDSFSYLNNSGKHTPHGDYYQIGETYLMLNELSSANYKVEDTLANLDYNMARDWESTTAPSGLGLDNSRDWSHLGWWWCDALYMAMNSYTLMTLRTGDSSYVEKAYEGYLYWKSVLYNETYHLWHRDSTQFNVYTNLTDENGNKVPTFWSRGNAWVLAALAKQLIYLDEEEYPEIYETYLEDYLELAEAIAQYQREDGTWNASIVDETYYGGKETTGTCGFIYSYCIGLNLGLLDEEIYYPIVSKAYDCVVNECMYSTGQVGYMQTTGYQPQNYKSEEYSATITHEFGMGLFLLACSGMMRICSDYETPAIYIPADPQAALLG